LLPDGHQAALVMFGNKVQYMRMISGLVEKIYETGHVENVECKKVYEGDIFEWTQGSDENIVHKRKLGDIERPIIAVYTVIYLKGRQKPSIHVMETGEINQIRDDYARTPDKGPWAKSWEQMAYKTCLRQHCKTKPLQAKFKTLFEDHDQFHNVDGDTYIDVTPGATGTETAKQALDLGD
jgi:recombination protein RecT